MSKQWPTAKLGEVLRHRKEFITIDDLTNYKRPRAQLHVQGIVLRDEVPGALIKTKTQQVCRAGEFLVAEIDAKVGGFGIVPESLDGSIVSSHYFLFLIDDAKLDRRFLDFFIRTPAFRGQVAAQGSTNYAAIRPAHVLGYEIPLPPLAEQRRVVARIEELAAQIHEARTLRHQAAAEADALLTTARRATIWQSKTNSVLLEDVCTAIIDNLHSNPRLSEIGIPCIRSPDVGFGTLNLDGAQRTDEEEFNRRTVRGEPREDDIVLVREGGGTGKCAAVQRGQRFSLGQRVMMLRPNTQRILPRFFLHQLLSPQIQEDQIAPLSKGSASPHLNIGALRKFDLALPPLSEQRRIVAELDALQSEVDALKRLQAETAAELDALLPAILDKAFKGEL
ncbi:MAG: restriction endonuclease subunit S [Verrucomicrobia subdivision 3 bacterium]|nr:restriction endonuclease subunit S [Limisphaerales bacterium]